MVNGFVAWEFIGFIFVTVIGTILHFAYDWSGHNRFVGILSPVNESTWEHLKLLFTPMLLYSIVEYLVIGKKYSNFIPAKLFGMLFGMFVIVDVFYTYTGIIGNHFLLADILTFLLGVAAAYIHGWKIIQSADMGTQCHCADIVLILVLAAGFATFTFSPPHIGLFLDPVSRQYGIDAKTFPKKRT